MPKVDIAKTFSKAISVSKQELKVTELQKEIEELRRNQAPELEEQLEELRKTLRDQSGEKWIRLSEIRINNNQPRQTFSEESIESLASSLQKDGQISPIIVIPEDGFYLLWDGERRYRSALKLNWDKIKAVTSPMPADLHRKALLTFIHHEELNALDKAEAIVQEIHKVTNINSEDIPSGVRALVRRLERNNEIPKVREVLNQSRELQQATIAELELSDEQSGILGVVLDLQLNPASIAANDLQMLNLFDDLKQSIRNEGLKGSHALVLQKLSSENLQTSLLKAKNIRKKAISKVVKGNLNVPKTKLLVQNLIEKSVGVVKEDKLAKEFKSLVQKINKVDFSEFNDDQLQELRNFFQIKLNNLDSLID